MNDEEFIDFLKNSLPPYIVECFIRTGYDSARVVAQLSTGGDNNSIDEMEKYILKEYPNDPSCHFKMSTDYVFVPGHRIRIANFIDDVKNYKVPVKRKLSNQNLPNVKKIRLSEDESACRYDLRSISDCVRKRIFDWVQKHDTLSYLKEHQDYTVKVKLDTSSKPVVSVLCSECNKEYKLHNKESTMANSNKSKSSTFMISNWTNHVKKCFDAKGRKKKTTK